MELLINNMKEKGGTHNEEGELKKSETCCRWRTLSLEMLGYTVHYTDKIQYII